MRRSIESTLYKGQTTHRADNFCGKGWVVSVVYRILVVFLPYTSNGVQFFPTGAFIGVKLLMDGDLTAPILQMEIMAN